MPYEKVGDNEPVCIADEVPFEIPDGWEWCRLAFANEIYTGNSINENVKKQKYTNLKEGYNYISTKDVGFNNEIAYDNGIKIPFNENNFKIADKNSVLLCIEGGSAGRKIAFLKEDVCFGNKLCCFKQYCINEKFLYYYLQSNLFTDVFKENTTGIIGGVSVNTIKSLFLPLPPYQEQQRIVTEIEKYLPLINEYDKLQTELNKLNAEFPEKLKKSILQQAIQGKLVEQDSSDEPASILLEKIRKEKEKLIKEGKIKKDKNESIIYKRDNSYYEKLNGVEKCIDDEIPFEIPESWEWCRIGNIGTMGRGTGIKRNETTEKGYPCVRYGELYTKYSYKFSQTHSFVPKNIFEKSYKISYGDLVYTLTGETKQDIAKTATFIGNGNVAVGGDLAFWKHHYMNSLYLEYFMFSPYCINSKINLSTGDIIVHISVDKISSILIPVPPLQEQQSIVSKIEQLFNILNTKII